MIITLGTTPTIQRSMTFKIIETDEVNRAIAVREYASGKSVNAARVLHALRQPVAALSIAGGDRGVQMRRDLASAGIDHFFVDSAAQTRLCITLIDESNSTATELVEEAGKIEVTSFEELLQRLRSVIGRCELLMMCGSLAPGAGDDFYARCIRLANEKNILTLLDTRGEPLKQALAKKPTIVKPNRSELADTVGHSIDSDDALRDAMRRVVEMGARWIVVTGGGKHPTTVSDGKSFWRIDVPKIKVVSPIGSGDSFAAGLAAGVRQEQSVHDACRLATACAAANAMTADAGFVRRDDVERLFEQIEVSEWNR